MANDCTFSRADLFLIEAEIKKSLDKLETALMESLSRMEASFDRIDAKLDLVSERLDQRQPDRLTLKGGRLLEDLVVEHRLMTIH